MTDPDAVIQLPCVCTTMRRATRALTRFYDASLRETGLRSTQFTLLQALHIAGEIRQGQLGAILSLDTTTLTRSLRSLVDAGLVKSETGEDRRERYFRLTPAGERRFQDAMPAWRKVQNQVKKTIGLDWERLERDLRAITASVT